MSLITTLPRELVQRIGALVPDINSLRAMGFCCRAFYNATLNPESQYWREYWKKVKGSVEIQIEETPKAAIRNFFQETVECIHTMTKRRTEDPQSTTLVRIFRQALSKASIISRFHAVMVVMRDFRSHETIALEAAKKGYLRTMRILLKDVIMKDDFRERCAKEASKAGNLPTLQWLNSLEPLSISLRSRAIVEANSPPVIGFILSLGSVGEAYQVVARVAAANGDLATFESLFRKRSEGVDRGLALIGAITTNDLDKTRELLSRDISHFFRGHALIFASTKGGRIFEILLEEGKKEPFEEYYFGEALSVVASRGDISDLLLLLRYCPHPNNSIVTRAMRHAVKNGHLPIVQKLLPQMNEMEVDLLLILAAECGHAHLLPLLLKDSHTVQMFHKAFDQAARNGHLEALRFFLSKATHTFPLASSIVAAAAGGHLECVKLLLPLLGPDAFHEGIRTEALLAAKAGHYTEIVKLLESLQRVDQKTS